jgi:hypothetical protein
VPHATIAAPAATPIPPRATPWDHFLLPDSIVHRFVSTMEWQQ